MSILRVIPLLICIAGCSGGTSTPREAGLALLATTATAPNFGDADLHDWSGRRPQSYPVHGIDISRWQGSVDWPTARANGVNFAFLKATEGSDIADPLYKTNWQGARRAGVPRGAYHYFYLCGPASQQARWFIAHVPAEVGALPPVLDMEWTPTSPTCRKRPDATHIRAEAAVFLNTLERHYGQRPILYTTVDFYRDNQLHRLPRTEFWLRSVAGHPQDTFAGQHWTFWQYTGTGLVPGVGGRTDINVFAGSVASWQNWLYARSLN